MNPEQSQALRAPFAADKVGKLPRITCKACSESRSKLCPDHKKVKCAECDNFITERHMHIDYVGHGAVTDRLLEVDPEWTWQPLALDQAGMPVFVYDGANPIALWIRLTVCGVTRLGVGTCPAGQDDAEKVLIGDALRNAAMRFGVAVDLWIKGHGEDDERAAARQAPASEPPTIHALEAKGRLLALAGGDKEAAAAAWDKAGLTGRSAVTGEELTASVLELHELGWSWAPNDAGGAPDSDAGDTAPTEPAEAGRADMDEPPASSTANSAGQQAPQGLTARQVGQRCVVVFKADYDAAPRGQKTRILARLRHALVYALTDGAVSSLGQCDGQQLLQVWQALDAIAEGRLRYEVSDPYGDVGGVSWVDQDGKGVTVMWSEVEGEPDAGEAA